MTEQMDLFGSSVPSGILREEERFGKWDAKTGLPLRNQYSSRIKGERLAAYERGYREYLSNTSVNGV